MPPGQQARKLQPDDILLRKLEPGTWDPTTGKVRLEAYVDNHPEQSFFVRRKKSAEKVLEYFAKMRRMREEHGVASMTSRDLYAKGYGVSETKVSDLTAMGFRFKATSDGGDYNRKGHVDLIGAKNRPWLIANISRALREDEIFPSE